MASLNSPHYLSRTSSALLLVFVVLVAFAVYWPSLFGSFVLDDTANLQNLENIEQASRLPELLLYVVSGGAGPTGRPVSLLTFALQHDSYPARPFDFKFVNVLLHLVNGFLAYLVVRNLATTLGRLSTGRARITAIAVTALWLLHPIHVSTVAYVVQRMNLLAAAFSLATVLAYLLARQCQHEAPRSSIALAWIGVPLFALLAVFSKETGASVLFILATLEFVFAPKDMTNTWRWWRRCALVVPLLFSAAALVLAWDDIVLKGYALKPFTLEERLLTQPRVLVDYLRVILVPASNAIGLFHDDYVVSRGLFAPAGTALSLALVAALVSTALLLKDRFPLIAAGTLWFFAGHLVESTVIPIELYFEHRNYVPSLGVLLAAAATLQLSWKQLRTRAFRAIAALAIVGYGCYVGLLALSESLLWGDPVRQAFVWAAENPTSRRAQTWKLTILDAMGNTSAALEQARRIEHGFDDPAFAVLTQIEMSCRENGEKGIPLPPVTRVEKILKTHALAIGPTNVTENLIHLKEFDACEKVPVSYIESMVRTLLANPAFESQRGLLLTQLARVSALAERPEVAIALLEEAQAEDPTVERALQLSVWLAYAGRRGESRRYLDMAQSLMSVPLIEPLAYRDRINYVLHVLEQREQDGEQ